MDDSQSKPSMNWRAGVLAKEWKRVKQHCEFTFMGPLANKTEVVKVNYFMTFIGDKGCEIYTTFYWRPEQGQGDDFIAAENETLAGVYAL